MNFTPLDLLNYGLIGFNIILSLIILNWTLCFMVLRHYPCIKPRQPITPIFIGLFNTIFVGIDRSQVLLHSNLTNPISYPRWILVNTVCVQIWMLTLFLLAYRGWIIYYDIQWNKSLADKQWRLYINPAEHNWFLRHRQSYGNPKKMIFPFLMPWLLTAIFYEYEIFKENQFSIYSRITLIVQTLMVMTFLIFIWYKMPKFDDIWRIRHELILAIRILIIGLAIFFTLGILLNWQPSSWKYTILSSVATIGAFLQCYSILFYPLKRFKLPKFIWCAYIASKSVRLREHMERSQTQYRKKRSLGAGDDVDGNTNISTQFYKLKTILLHPDGFRLFAGHLMKELAIENLLFFVETSQWLSYVIQVCETKNVKISIDEKASGIDVKLDKHVPKSRIVCWNRDDDRIVISMDSASADPDPADPVSATSVASGTGTGHTQTRPSGTITASTQPSSIGGHAGIKSVHSTQLTIDLNLEELEVGEAINDPWMQSVKLFQKYIINGSYFCINISGENRIELYEKFGYDTSSTKCDEELLEILKENCQNDMDKLFHVFDTARFAVFRLMIYSVSRFETSPAYLEHFIPNED